MRSYSPSREEAASEILRRRGITVPTAKTLAERLRLDPSGLLGLAGYPPDPWQSRLLRGSSQRALLLCSRQAGKSLTAAALALRTALLEPPALVLLLSPTLRQSGELFRDKVLRLWQGLGCPERGRPPTQLSLELANGSRIVSLPENESGIRGYSSVRLLVIDEASRVDDGLYFAVRPMLAVSGGSLIALSTPFGRRGWFFEEWETGEGWDRVKVTAHDCLRIPAEFLEEERRSMPARAFAQEYEVEFCTAVGQAIPDEDIDAAVEAGTGARRLVLR